MEAPQPPAPEPDRARRKKSAEPDAGDVVAPAYTGPIASGEDARRYLDSLLNVELLRPTRVDRGEVFKLARMHALVDALGKPHQAFRCVHVAGSKGKGSVCEMTAAALCGCGLTVGIFTSPHLIDMRERIRINGEWIADSELASCLDRVAEAARGLPKELGTVTHFEALTACALVHFADQAVDIALIEVGLGGLHDATNVITPTVCAITAIQREHTQLLGETLEEIAAHKAGIMKPGVPCITVGQDKGAMAVFRQTAEQVGCELRVIGEDLEFSSRFAAVDQTPSRRISVTTPRRAFEHIVVPLKGEHQAHNCGVALGIIDALAERGVQTPEGAVAAGLARTAANGRLEVVCREPRTIVDGAHTPESIGELIKSLGAHVRYDSLVVVFGCAADKDATGILQKIAGGADKVFFTKAGGSTRAMDPRELIRRYHDITGKTMQAAPTMAAALELAEKAVQRGDVLCITGSFLIAGEAKRHYLAKAAKASVVEIKPRR